MAKNHYETLGVDRRATGAEIKSAYRKLVLQHHPDRSSDTKSRDIFLSVTEAYEVLSDPERRRQYDTLLSVEAQRRAAPAQPKRPDSKPKTQGPPRPAPSVAPDVTRLSAMFARGRYADAEKLARSILDRDSRQPIPYAILGDIMRYRGNRTEALKMYAYAAQMDPRNTVYQRRYEELLSSVHMNVSGHKVRLTPQKGNIFAPFFGPVVCLISACYIAWSPERSAFDEFPLVSSWTLGLFFMLLIAGIAIGAGLSAGGAVDRFTAISSGATGRAGPAFAIGLVAIINFWLAALLYGLLGLAHRTFDVSTTRLLAFVAVAVGIFSVASAASSYIEPVEVLAWSGNILYGSALLGWIVADAFRE